MLVESCIDCGGSLDGAPTHDISACADVLRARLGEWERAARELYQRMPPCARCAALSIVKAATTTSRGVLACDEHATEGRLLPWARQVRPSDRRPRGPRAKPAARKAAAWMPPVTWTVGVGVADRRDGRVHVLLISAAVGRPGERWVATVAGEAVRGPSGRRLWWASLRAALAHLDKLHPCAIALAAQPATAEQTDP